MSKQNKNLIVALALAGVLCLTTSRGLCADSPVGKKPITVGFSQIGAESGWRTAEASDLFG